EGGQLFHFNLTGNRQKIAVDDPRLEDRVADNNNKFDITESESLLFGRNFGIVTDIETGPNGNLFVVSLTNGAIYEIFRRDLITALGQILTIHVHTAERKLMMNAQKCSNRSRLFEDRAEDSRDLKQSPFP